MKLGVSLAAAAVAALVLGCRHAEEPAQAPEPTAVRVRAAEPKRGPIREIIEATGETTAFSLLRLASPIAGRVTRLDARPGDTLAAGAVAARLTTAEGDAAVRGLVALDNDPMLPGADRETARRLRHELELRAVVLRVPFTAVVSQRMRNPGEEVPVGEVLLEVFDPRSLEVIAQVPVDEVGRIRSGLPVDIEGTGAPADASSSQRRSRAIGSQSP